MMDIAAWIATRVAALRKADVWKNVISVPPRIGSETGFVIDIDGSCVIAQFIVWTTGAMEATAGKVADGQVFYVDAAPTLDEAMLDERWRQFYSEILRVEEGGR
jgi:hypothetical protein